MKQEYIQFAPLFAGLAEDEQAVLAENFIQGQTAAGGMLFKTGDQADGLYLIGKGFVRLLTGSGVSLATLGPGSVLGEDSLFRNLPYDVSAAAVSDLEYWKLADRTLRDMIVEQPAVGLKLSNNFGSLIAQMQDYLVQRLGKTAELNNLPRHTLQAVADHLQPRRLAAGQYLYRSGDPPSGLYLVESGSIEIQPESGDERSVARGGALLGSLGVITNKPSTGNAVATEDTVLWVLTAEDFQAINSRQPGLRRSLGRNVRARLSRADQMEAMLRLQKMPIFADLPPQTMQAIVQRMVLQHVPAGERVYRIGEAGDSLYLIESGEIELTAENAMGVVEEIGRIGSDSHFGELSLLTGQIRMEDATATRNSNLWVLYKSDLDALATQYPAIGKALSRGVAARLSSGAASDETVLRRFALFSDLNPSDLNHIAGYLQPMRYRAGEQIFRANSEADKLFLLDKGQVRMQASGGGGWMLGPGETFGERALLTGQPHNTTVVAESDVDVWTLNKQDFELLMNRFPSLAISMSRLLSQRLAQATGQPGIAPATLPAGAPPPYLPTGSPGASSPSSRRRQAAAAAPLGAEGQPRRRQGFGDWYANLSGFGKLRFALLILLIILLLCITVPFTVLAILNGPAAATRAVVSTLSNAINSVYAAGSYDRLSLAEQLLAADAGVPPTPTYTPYPTETPQPTPTPLPTNTPQPTATAEPILAQSFADIASALEDQATPAPEAVVQAAAPRNLDARLGQLGISIEDAAASPGQQYWRLIEVRFEDEGQAGGKHHIYVDVLDENGNRLVGQPVTVYWGDGNFTAALEDKAAPDMGFNYQMYAAGYAYNVKVEGLPSDTLRGAGMGDVVNRFSGIHVAYYLVFQRAVK